MIFSQAAYRIRQFWLVWQAPALSEADFALIQSVLTAEQTQLFTRLHPSEKIHALRVLQTVLQSGENNPDLQTAALLHDVGKLRAPLKLWERIFIVLGRRIFGNRTRRWGGGNPQGWMRPFVVAEQHPAWGGELASAAGASPLTVALIVRHQFPFFHCF